MILFLSIFLGLIAMLAYSMSNVTLKMLSQKLPISAILFLRGIPTIILLGLVSLSSLASLTHLPALFATFALGLFGYVPILFFTKGVKNSPLGIIAPIAGTSPLITVVLSFFFLGLAIHPFQWVAIFLVVVANVLVSLDVKNWRQSKLLQTSSGIPYAMLAALGWGLFYFLLVPATRALNPLVAAWIAECGVTVAAGIHMLLSSNKVHIQDALNKTIIFSGVLIAIGTVGFTVGVQYYNVSIIEVLSNSGSLATTLLGIYFFQEKLHPKDRWATLLMIAGVILLFLL